MSYPKYDPAIKKTSVTTTSRHLQNSLMTVTMKKKSNYVAPVLKDIHETIERTALVKFNPNKAKDF